MEDRRRKWNDYVRQCGVRMSEANGLVNDQAARRGSVKNEKG